ncbi:MAG: DUF6348 family protein [Fimbriiglobus sp.]
MDADVLHGLEAVAEHLRRDGLPAAVVGGRVRLGVADAELVVLSEQVQSSADGGMHVVSVRVGVRLGPGRPPLFEDMVSGFGPTRRHAAVAAFVQLWLHGDLVPCLPVLGGPAFADLNVIPPEDPQGCPPWTVYTTSYQCASTEPDAEMFGRAVHDSPPFVALREIFARDLDLTRPHWVKLFRQRSDGPEDFVDCRIDEQDHPAGTEAIANWPWPAVGDDCSFRFFGVLVPTGMDHPTALRLLEEAALAPAAAVRRVALTVTNLASFTENDVYAALENAGLPSRIADRAYKMTQTAWARATFGGPDGVQFPPEYYCFNAAGDLVESGRLPDEPFYTAAVDLIPEFGPAEGFRNLVLMSSEVHALSDAINKGSKLKDLRGSPAAMFVEPATPDGMKRVVRFLTERAGR